MCVETLTHRLFFQGVTCLGLLLKNVDIFPSMILVTWNPINVCSHLYPWRTITVESFSEQGIVFSKTIDLRGHMPRFTLKNEHFPIYLLRTLKNVCWNPHNMDCFLRQDLIWGVTCLGLLQKWMFSHLSPEKPHKCVIFGVSLKKFTFSHLCPWKHYKCVLKPS